MKQDIAIIGCMGSGKSTIAKEISKRLGYTLFEESFLGNNFLIPYYQKPVEYALQCELWFLYDKAKQQEEIAACKNSTVQDSPFASVIYFSRAMYDCGRMNKHDYDLFNKVAHMVFEKIPKPTRFVYLDVSEDTLMNRIYQRGRTFEQGSNFEYLMKAREHIERMVSHSSEYIHPVSRVDGEGSIENVTEAVLNVIDT